MNPATVLVFSGASFVLLGGFYRDVIKQFKHQR